MRVLSKAKAGKRVRVFSKEKAWRKVRVLSKAKVGERVRVFGKVKGWAENEGAA